MTLIKFQENSIYQKTLPPNETMFAFCGIADPDSFICLAKTISLNICGSRYFKDHQEYSDTIIKELSDQIKLSNINNVLTTEKDLVKLPASFLLEFEIYIIKINIDFANEVNIQNLIKSLFLN